MIKLKLPHCFINLTLRLPGGVHWAPPPDGFFHFNKKIAPTTYDETSRKFLYHTCGKSYALIWSKKIDFRTF